jgi:hypothetical protein
MTRKPISAHTNAPSSTAAIKTKGALQQQDVRAEELAQTFAGRRVQNLKPVKQDKLLHALNACL